MTQGQAGGKTWAGEQDRLLGMSRVIMELGTTSNPRRLQPCASQGLLSTPGPLAATQCRKGCWELSAAMGQAGGWLQGCPGKSQSPWRARAGRGEGVVTGAC